MGTLIVRPKLDIDAKNYIDNVQDADNAFLEPNVKQAVNLFVTGCKRDGIWDAIKSCCILCGARTLAGALVSLKGTAPTNFNFVAGDYNRNTGLKGDASTKYLNINRLNNADPQNNFHLSVYLVAPLLGFGTQIGVESVSSSAKSLDIHNNLTYVRSLNAKALVVNGVPAVTLASFLYGQSRILSSGHDAILSGVVSHFSINSNTPSANPLMLFCRTVNGTATPTNYYGGRISFYSAGEGLNLALLNTRIQSFMNTLNSVIPQ